MIDQSLTDADSDGIEIWRYTFGKVLRGRDRNGRIVAGFEHERTSSSVGFPRELEVVCQLGFLLPYLSGLGQSVIPDWTDKGAFVYRPVRAGRDEFGIFARAQSRPEQGTGKPGRHYTHLSFLCFKLSQWRFELIPAAARALFLPGHDGVCIGDPDIEDEAESVRFNRPTLTLGDSLRREAKAIERKPIIADAKAMFLKGVSPSPELDQADVARLLAAFLKVEVPKDIAPNVQFALGLKPQDAMDNKFDVAWCGHSEFGFADLDHIGPAIRTFGADVAGIDEDKFDILPASQRRQSAPGELHAGYSDTFGSSASAATGGIIPPRLFIERLIDESRGMAKSLEPADAWPVHVPLIKGMTLREAIGSRSEMCHPDRTPMPEVSVGGIEELISRLRHWIFELRQSKEAGSGAVLDVGFVERFSELFDAIAWAADQIDTSFAWDLILLFLEEDRQSLRDMATAIGMHLEHYLANDHGSSPRFRQMAQEFSDELNALAKNDPQLPSSYVVDAIRAQFKPVSVLEGLFRH